jgi:exopolysaccharide biosynthesis protein
MVQLSIREVSIGLLVATCLAACATDHRSVAESGVLLHPGITYEQRDIAATHPARAHIVAIDLRQRGLHFGVTAADTSKGMEQVAWTTSTYMARRHAQLAINGGFFSPWKAGSTGQDDYYPHEGDPVNASGALISDGHVVSPIESIKTERINAMLCFNRSKAEIVDGQTCPEGFTNGVAAGPRLLSDGKAPPLTNEFATTLHPRTAFGISANRERAWMVTIDGRQADSKGMSLTDLAALLASLGAADAINLDGGGSSTLVMESDDGKAKILNRPIQTGVVGKERPVANHVLVFFPHAHASQARD